MALARFAARARRAAGVSGRVDILIASSREIQELNRQFRRKNKPTDVLSFPAGNAARGIAGDIAISADIAAENAYRLGHEPVDELKILILHGMLHLAGYDHESDSGEMAREEERLRKELKLTDNLIARANGAGARRRRR